MSDTGSKDPAATPLIDPRRPRSLRLSGFDLIVCGGAGDPSGQIFRARPGRIVVGSHESADLGLDDPAVSRFHCEIVTEKGAPPTIRDLSSRNGTSIDGVSITSAHLHDGAVVTLGRTRLRVSRAAADVEIALSPQTRFGRLIGESDAMRAVFDRLERAAVSDATILLEGETGTGKEAAARSIHEASVRSGSPMVVVDCGAIPAELLESELFGHARGAFTGAVSERTGAFEESAGGTIFLDEIGELEPELQPRLLRALENREIKRVGETGYRSVDVRVIAATHRDLESDVNRGRFRADLFYRLAVVRVRLPGLAERPEDVPLLARHLLDALSAESSYGAELMADERFLARLQGHRWPGNVRELRNYLERCVALREISEPAPRRAPGDGGDPICDVAVPLKEARARWNAILEERYVRALLERHDGNVTAAARDAGVGRVYLHRLIARYRDL